MHRHFEIELERLRERLLEMGDLVQRGFHLSVQSLHGRNGSALANRVRYAFRYNRENAANALWPGCALLQRADRRKPRPCTHIKIALRKFWPNMTWAPISNNLETVTVISFAGGS